MAFDSQTRNNLQRMVGACRRLLADEFDDQLQGLYGIYAQDGRVLELEKLTSLDDDHHQTATLLRDRINHLTSGMASEKQPLAEIVRRVLREQAFTLLNRFAALRMAEERGFVQECVGQGLKSKGFQVFETVARSGLGGAYERYGTFIHGMFDELSLDLGVLFDRWSPFGLLFPREPALLKFFDLLNDPELKPLWKEDETIGWIYQYFNDEAERKKMREESSAPRNSRELAVRNQFFTPRYVVEFLTDNTLGRIWYEMTRGETKLKEQCRYLVRRPNEIFLKPGEKAPEQPKQDNLSQEDLLKQPVHIAHRPIKDPRTILMLDPACGSMHFGLYAFDLFEVIYDEAWELEEKLGADALGRPPGMKSLHHTYATKQDFLKDVPRLIIEHNLHGIDIDPRCAQIAGLSLWLRAQKAWQRLGLKPAERPAIKRSNIVCAEPMPGEKELLREFVEREFPAEERGVCLRLLEAIFDKMQLAGEAGSLLKIEEEIRSAIEDARRQWQTARQRPEFFDADQLAALDTRAGAQQELPAAERASMAADLRSLTSEDFWERIEERIYAALRDYAEQAENGGGSQRRLFAEDAARGFAFIDVCRKRYDATVMNPPFGNPPDRVAGLLSQDAANNIYPAFVLRGAEMSVGFVGAITDRTFVVQQSFGKFRACLTSSNINLVALADLGWGVLDGADVQVATYIVRKGVESVHLFASLASSGGDAAEELRRVVAESKWTRLTKEVIRKLPSNAFAHTLPAAYLSHLGVEPSLRELAVLPRGLGSNDANRTYKAWYEVPANKIGPGRHYSSLSNGGSCSPFFRDDAGVAEWLREDGALLVEEGYSDAVKAYDQRNCEHYFSAGLSFPKQSSIFNVAALPQDAIPTREGKGIVLHRREELLSTLGYLNSAYARVFVEATNGLHKQSGPVGMTPVPVFPDNARAELARVALSAWQSIATTYRFDEACRLFVRAAHPKEFDHASLLNSNEVFKRIDEIVFGEIGVSADDLATIAASPQPGFVRFIPTIADELSYALGCAIGRWDIRYATGEQAAPELPDPFAPLPVCPPGQLQNAQGLPARPEDVPAAYPVRIPWDGILVDDPNHPMDIERRVREVIEIIWGGAASTPKAGGPTAEAIEHEACEILGAKSLRDYFRKPAGFFADHLKRYSKSRRQAPIYWPLSTASGSYTLWIYYHRLTDQTLFQCVNDFVKPKLEEVNRDIERLRGELQRADGGSSQQRENLEELEDFSIELKEFHDELMRVAGLPYKPNLNDGVLITASPLWKLFRLPKWQKELKACWEALEQEEYEWAHLAYTIWPDRVKKVCKTDRSIAIAHGLEELCEVKAPEKKAKRGKKQADAELTLEGGSE